MLRHKLLFLLIFTSIFSFFSCDNKSATEEENVIVMPGKADDFLSTTAQEYVLSGTSTVTLESSYETATIEEKLARAKELIEYKHVVIGWFLNVYLIEKSDHDSNPDYGGFKSLVKNGAYDDLEIKAVDNLTYSFKFHQLIGGTNDLLSILPTETGADGKRHFDLIMGKISNYDMAKLETNNEWYRHSPWSSFNPDSLSEDQLETLDLAIWPDERSTDAWIDYNSLFADGVVTMAIHFGWDYHDNYHEKHSETLYNWLINSMKFKSPVSSWSEYDHNSGPLTKTIMANGKEVRVELSIFYGKAGTETDPDTNSGGIVLEQDMRESFKTREIIMYSGHSGPFYGFALANWRKTDEGDLDDSEISSLDMPTNKYQVVLAEGCDTYALGQAFFENPAKEGHKYIDIITTTNSSNAATPETSEDFIRAIIGTDYKGNHKPQLYSELIGDMESNSYWFNTMYGIHGLDDNPHLHPYANLDNLCKTCSKNSDCGGIGNQCSKLGTEGKICTVQCSDDSGCPEGYQCVKSAQNYYVKSMQCVPLGYSCKNPEPEPGPSVIINEVLADPPQDISGDANHDGTRHYSEDEFVEFVNISDKDVDLSGWTLSDSFMVRFTFPEGTILHPGKALLVFGGGDTAQFNLPEGVLVFAADSGLGLNNSGDTITLSDSNTKPVDSMTYGSEGGKDHSLTRAVDGDPDASFVAHPDTPFSPGTHADGTSF